VLIDATIVRGVLLPAGLALRGERIWPQKPRGSRRAGVNPATPAAPAPLADGATVR
jgi:hypothetical protein